MKFKIINSDTEDEFILEEDSIEEIRKMASEEIQKRNWTNYYSEVLA